MVVSFGLRYILPRDAEASRESEKIKKLINTLSIRKKALNFGDIIITIDSDFYSTNQVFRSLNLLCQDRMGGLWKNLGL